MPAWWHLSTKAMKSFGRAVARRRREIAHHLVAPGAVERMFGDAHELDVRVAHVDDVGDQPLGRFRPGEERRLAIPGVLPARQVHFVDVDRRAAPVALRAFAQPVVVVPFVAVERGDDGRGLRALLHVEAERIGLEQHRVRAACGSRTCIPRLRRRPGTNSSQTPEPPRACIGMFAAVPEIEAADHAHAFGVRRPHGEVRAGDAVAHAQVRAELVVQRRSGGPAPNR